MKRQSIDGGGWLDLDSARVYRESVHWDGRNQISDATGSQWEHESLHVTRRGAYVLHRWSQWQGSGESWTRLDASDAAAWLVRAGHEPTGGPLATAAEALEA